MSGSASESHLLRETADATWKVLEGIVDPCSTAVGAPVGLVSLGLVLDVSVHGAPGAAIVNVELGITEPGCMMQGIFSATAEREIRALPGVTDVIVNIDHGHVWDPADMAADYQERLAKVREERRRRPRSRRSPIGLRATSDSGASRRGGRS